MESRTFAVSPWRSSDRLGGGLLQYEQSHVSCLTDTATFTPEVPTRILGRAGHLFAHALVALRHELANFRACMGGVLLALISFR